MNTVAEGDKDKPPFGSSSESSTEEKAVAKTQIQEEGENEIVGIAEEMPPEVRRQFQAFMAMFQAQSRPVHNPLLSKFNEAHIDKYLRRYRE